MYRLGFACVLLTSVAYAQPSPATEPSPEPAPTPSPSPAPDPAPAPAPVKVEPVKVEPAVVLVTPEPAKPKEDDWTMRVGGYIQPQFRVRQNSSAQNDEDGFRLARVRPTWSAEGKIDGYKLSAFIEAELQPTFTLNDAYATISRPLANKGVVTLDMGQTRVPISRQNLMSDSRLSFVDKGQVATIAPDRDLGARVWFSPPGLPQVRAIASAFNGEGKNQVQNINESFLYAGRVEITPIGPPQPYAESAFVEPFVSLAFSAGHNKLTPGDYHENVTYLGADFSGAWNGFSGSAEYLIAKHDYNGDTTKFPGPSYKANAWMVQAAYLYKQHFEIGGRLEEFDRNDAVPIPQLGDPAQSVREVTAVVSAYLRKHTCKAQLAFNHFQEIETKTSTGTDATYPNDQVVLQITYRVE